MKLETLFEKANFEPNDAQRKAILHVDGPLFLTAGPGSGKTRVLLWRSLNLIVFHGVDPAAIFLGTFTEKAARQLEDGLRSLLSLVTNETGKPYDISSMSVGTIHSLCQRLLVDRRFSEAQGRRRSPVVLDELGQYFRVYDRQYWKELLAAGGFDDEEAGQRAINAWATGGDSYSRHYAAQNTIAFFNRLSEEDYSGDGVEARDATVNALLAMYAKYREDLRSSRAVELVDFSVLQQVAYRHFLASERSSGVFEHVIVDEYQDTNAIQERIIFRLASGSKNLCVVGDDDQALYRFRGATVENLVDFESRCATRLGLAPRRLDLGTNYRSRRRIVSLCTSFIERADWRDPSDGSRSYRVTGKDIRAASEDEGAAVLVSARAKAEEVYREIARLVKRLKAEGRVEDYNQIAFLFPSMKGWDGMNTRVHGFIEALKEEGIPYYAPRAGRFLEVQEARAFFGLCQEVFGRPGHRERGDASKGMRDFQDWMASCRSMAETLVARDAMLAAFLKDRRAEVERAVADYGAILAQCASRRIDLASPVTAGLPQRIARDAGLSLRVQKALQSHQLDEMMKKRQSEGRPYSVGYLANRVTALDWGILDLFYQLNGFDYFRRAYELAESGEDEGPICNLGLVTQYLARFTEGYSPILTGQFLAESRFVNTFFSSFLYALFRLGESEYENADDPFPRGRVSFLTIHQAKGLEFPVVVLGSVYREARGPSSVEVAIRELTGKVGEPLGRIDEFDTMRAFYVALSRARNLLVLPRYTYAKAASPAFKALFDEDELPEIACLEPASLPPARVSSEDLGASYSYTGDFLPYRKCARNYMAFRKYGFVPSRGQSMFFGRLVHETIEDLHHLVMARKEGKEGR